MNFLNGTLLSSGVPVLGPSWILIFQGCFSLPCTSYVFYVDLCTREQEKWQERWNNFYPDLDPRNGSCQGTPTPAVLSTRDTRTPIRGTRFRVWFWLRRSTGACRGRGWKYQCIIYSVDNSMMLNYLPCSVMFMWRRRFLGNVFLIPQKCRIAIGMSCNQLMARRQRTKLKGAKKRATCLFFHQDKLWFQQNRI